MMYKDTRTPCRNTWIRQINAKAGAMNAKAGAMELKGRKRTYIGIGVLAVAVFLIAVGIARDEMLTVFVRAINICLECIGLG